MRVVEPTLAGHSRKRPLCPACQPDIYAELASAHRRDERWDLDLVSALHNHYPSWSTVNVPPCPVCHPETYAARSAKHRREV